MHVFGKGFGRISHQNLAQALGTHTRYAASGDVVPVGSARRLVDDIHFVVQSAPTVGEHIRANAAGGADFIQRLVFLQSNGLNMSQPGFRRPEGAQVAIGARGFHRVGLCQAQQSDAQRGHRQHDDQHHAQHRPTIAFRAFHIPVLPERIGAQG